MNTIGMSLPYRYLTGESPTPFDPILGPLETGLALLKSRGVDSIEIRVALPQADPQMVLQLAQRVWNAGLELTIHSALPLSPAEESFEAWFPSLQALIGPLRERGKVLPITVHAYQHKVTPHAELAQHTVASLGSLTLLCEQSQLPYRFALELNRSKQVMDPSVTYESVLAMHDQVRHPALGLCWDFGHGYSNFTNGLIPRDPPASFLQSVIHTHIHDLAPAGKTHWPLTERRLPLQTYVDLLKSVNYQGVWNLELSPERCDAGPQLGEQILKSVDILRQAVGV